jgi:hypothetical protein
VTTESERLKLRLESGRRRWHGERPHVRYIFNVVAREDLPLDGEPGHAARSLAVVPAPGEPARALSSLV